MNRGTRMADEWRDTEEAVPPPAAPATEADYVAVEAEPVASSPGRAIVAIGLIAVAVAWIGFVAWTGAMRDAALAGLARDIAIACVPLALVAILFVVLRGGNALRFGGNAAALDAQVQAIDAQLAGLARRLADDRTALAEHGRTISEAGANASGSLAEAAATMRADADLLAREGRALEYAAAAARTDLLTLAEGMPRVEERARVVAETLQQAGGEVERRLKALDVALAALAERGRAVDGAAGAAAARLAGEVERLDRSGAAAAGRLDGAAERLSAEVDGALVHAAEAMERSRAIIDEQAAAMRALVDQARTAIQRTGQETAEAAQARMDALATQIDAIGERLVRQDAAARDLIGGLNAGLRAIEGRFADLGETGAAEGARLAASVQSVAAYAEQVREGLVVGGDAADALIARAGTLAERLEGPARVLHETLPEAIARAEQQARRSLSAVNEVAPQMARLETVSAALGAQVEASTALVAEIDRQMVAATERATALGEAIGDADRQARLVSHGSAVGLIEAMTRVRETAAIAAERAREAIAQVIPDSANALAEAGGQALAEGVTRAVDEQVGRLNAASEAASAAAGRAAERLAGQMRQLGETTAAVEQRLASAQEKAEAASLENFPRRAAHLIDALNSAAIDVAKMLSAEVTDTVWAAYLKGDRGVFTRRAVKLIENGEARDIGRFYGEDPEFRDQVNRYVHDFEALLRPVMAGRDGAPLAVTLLGSDMGKLYVALAQAISRLRG